MPISKDVKVEIEEVRKQLNQLMNRNNSHLASDHIVRFSQELDQVIKKYYAA